MVSFPFSPPIWRGRWGCIHRAGCVKKRGCKKDLEPLRLQILFVVKFRSGGFSDKSDDHHNPAVSRPDNAQNDSCGGKARLSAVIDGLRTADGRQHDAPVRPHNPRNNDPSETMKPAMLIPLLLSSIFSPSFRVHSFAACFSTACNLYYICNTNYSHIILYNDAPCQAMMIIMR